jgi:hypothetical protein
MEVARRLSFKGAFLQRGLQASLARELGVSRATICRDVQAIMAWGHPCRFCGAGAQPPPEELMVEEAFDMTDDAALGSTAGPESIEEEFHRMCRQAKRCLSRRFKKDILVDLPLDFSGFAFIGCNGGGG